MFRIRYRLVEEELDELRTVNSATFESEWGDINGQIHLTFGEHEFGYVSNEVPFGNEPLLLLFNVLVDTLISLNESNYALMNQLGKYGAWIQFERHGDNVEIGKLRFEPKGGHAPFVITSRPVSDEIQVESYGVSVLLSDMIHEITSQCTRFLEDIYRLNSEIYNTRKVRDLMGKIRRFE